MVAPLQSQVCTNNGNVAIFSNYDGGYLTIDVNQNIPNLKIGIASYEPVAVTFTGAFAANVTEVIYAGYQPATGTGNFHCDNNLAVTNIAAPINATLTIYNTPPVTLLSPEVPIFPGSTFLVPAGDNNNITSCSSCENNTYQGGSNTAEQIADFFLTEFGGELLFLKTQYECWCGVQNMDIPATCCVELSPTANVSITTGSGGVAVLCEGSSLELDAGPGYSTYNWSTGENTPAITVTEPGNYGVTISSDCGTASDVIVVTEEPAPEFSLTSTDQFDCLGGSVTVTPVNPAGSYTYTITDQNGTIIPNTNGLAQGLEAGTYTIEVSVGTSDCSSTQTITIVDAGPAFSYSFTSSDADCQNAGNGSIVIDLDIALADNYTYEVLDLDGNLIVTGSLIGTTMIPDLPPGDYTVSINGATFGCTESFNASIAGASLSLTNSTVQDLLCADEAEGSIFVQPEGGQVPYSFVWTDADGNELGYAATLENLSAGTYFLEVTDAGDCLENFEFEVLAPARLEIDWQVEDISCSGENDGAIFLTGNGGISPYSFSLDGTTFQTDNSFMDLAAGVFTPVIQDANNCISTGDMITISQPPVLEVFINSSPSIALGENTTLSTQIPPTWDDQVTYSWSPTTGLSCTDCPAPVASPVQTTTYTVEVTTPDGCLSTATRTIEVLREINYYLPNAFSPDQDGKNDRFEVYLGTGVQEVRQMKIFDRWGGLVYDGQAASWDGLIGGELAPAGVYTYLLELLFVDGTLEQVGGSVHLLR